MRLAAWVVAATVAAAVLSATGAGVRVPEAAHWLGHAILFGLPPAALARRGVPVGRAVASGVLAGAVVEAAQRAAVGRLLVHEAAFDLALDAIVAMAGALATGGVPAARALGTWLHPAVLLAGTAAVRGGDAGDAAIGAAALSPAVGVWLGGVATGRFSDVDLSRRQDRTAPFLLALAGLPVVVWAADVGAPLAAALGVTGAGFVAVTALGGKPSGHVAGALVAGVLLAGSEPRWAGLAVAAAALLAVARVRAGVHTWAQVAAGAAFGAAPWAVATL